MLEHGNSSKRMTFTVLLWHAVSAKDLHLLQLVGDMLFLKHKSRDARVDAALQAKEYEGLCLWRN